MNEVSRCCRVLNVQHGATFEEVKTAYRDLVQVWHPDRFAGNERLQASAQDKLKEINLAWEYLSANAFCDGVLVEPEDEAAESAASANGQDLSATSDFGTRRAKWSWLFGAAVLVIVGALALIWHRHQAPILKQTSMASTNAGPVSQSAESIEPAATPRIFPFATDVLAGNARTNWGTGWLEFSPLLEPPFAVRLEATVSDLSEFRVHYAMAQLIFNWADQLKNLLIVSPQAFNTTVPGEGILLPGSRREILWIIRTNSMAIEVDGKTRFQTNDDFSRLKGRVSVQTFTDPVNLTGFEIQTPKDPLQSKAASSEHAIVANDILPTMIPETNLTEHFGPEGATIRTAVDWSSHLMSGQSFRPPFTMRTRAKTDAFNLRLFCENGMIIFNWEWNSRELRVHDPLSGAGTPIANQGFVLPNEWHDISWSIQPMGMTLIVDGKIRFQNHRDYRTVNGKVGIAPFKSELTIDYFVVEKE